MNRGKLESTVRKYLQVLELRLMGAQVAKLQSRSWLLAQDQEVCRRISGLDERARKRATRCAFAGGVAAIVLVLIQLIAPTVPQSLDRPQTGSRPVSIEMQVAATYRNYEVNRPMTLYINPKAIEPEEEREQLRRLSSVLSERIIGDNLSLNSIATDLTLPAYDAKSGAYISWESSDPNIIAHDGRVNLFSNQEGTVVSLTAVLRLGSSEFVRIYSARLAEGKREDYEKSMANILNRIQKELSESTDGMRLYLPDETEESIKLDWRRYDRVPFLIPIPVCALIVCAIYLSRYGQLDKELKHRLKEIDGELPNLFLQLTLLLNAGLVVAAAFEVIISGNENRPHALYDILKHIRIQCVKTNESFSTAFYAFAKASGNRELFRMATLIIDHESKGSELARKLERERTHIWDGRLQQARARAKEVETKLCLPLMLLLGVLVVIAIAPALLEMR